MKTVEATRRTLVTPGPRPAGADRYVVPIVPSSTVSKNESDLFERLGISNGYEGSLDVQIPNLDPATRTEIDADITSGRILSLRSSTALAVNFFGPWRSSPAILGAAFGAPWVEDLRFEVKYPTELSDKPVRLPSGEWVDRSPTLDVVLDGDSEPTLAIEAKFTEPYFKRPSNGFSASYFRSDVETLEPGTDPLWEGLPLLREFAIALDGGGMVYQFLHAAQLIKHALGLRRRYGGDGFWLNYVWFDGSDEVSRAHRREIEHFVAIASEEIHIGAISYQELSGRLGPDANTYVRERYRLDDDPIADPDRNQVLPTFAQSRNKIGKSLVVRGQVSDRFRRISPVMVAAEYGSLVRQAPRRDGHEQPYFVPTHHRKVSAPAESVSETHLQRALVGKALVFESEPSVHLIDYEVPTKASQADIGLGEADLFGVEDDGRHVVIELKVARDGEDDSPVRALLEALTYSAVLSSNSVTISAELRADRQRFGLESYPGEVPPAMRLIVAAPTTYWDRLEREPGWLDAAEMIIRPIADATGVSIEFVDLGHVNVDRYDDPKDGDGRVIPVLFVNGSEAPAEIRCTVLASWVPSR